MRKIKYKAPESDEYKIYIDIGSCERDYYSVDFYLPNHDEDKSGKIYFGSYSEWFENFKLQTIGSKLIIINYYLMEYMGWNSENVPQIDYFKDVYGEKTADILSKNLDFLLKINNKWFDYQSNLFNGLDLDWEDIQDRFVDTKEDYDGIITEIEFDDHSVILFLDKDDTVRSFYVSEEDYLELKQENEIITAIFKP